MKYITVFIFYILFIIFLPACHINTDTNRVSATELTVMEKKPFTPVDKNSVEWMKMTGGLGNITTRILFKENDDVVIQKLIDMINESREMFCISKKTIDIVHPKVRPIGMIISFIDGNRFYLWPSYDMKNHSGGLSVSTRTDCFTLEIENDGESLFYTIFSEEMADYLIEGWKEDMPVVEDVRIESDTTDSSSAGFILQNGDRVTISGDGCSNKIVNIYTCSNNGVNRYLLGTSETILGAWKWEGKVTRSIHSCDGTYIQLSEGLYDIVVDFGDREKIVSGIISLK